MSLSLTVALSREFTHSTVYTIQTSKTFYQVIVNDVEVHVVGPGVDESYLIGPEVPDALSSEGKAALAIILWEEGE